MLSPAAEPARFKFLGPHERVSDKRLPFFKPPQAEEDEKSDLLGLRGGHVNDLCEV